MPHQHRVEDTKTRFLPMTFIFPHGWRLSECLKWLRKRGCKSGYLGWWHDHERQKHGFALEPK